MTESSILQKCYDLSISNLIENSTEFGLAAANLKNGEGQNKNYSALFSRDVGVSVVGMALSKNAQLLDIAKKSLVTLTHAQNERGQFPFYYKPQIKEVKWWTPGSIDSSLWWGIAFLVLYKTTQDEDFFNQYKNNIARTFEWLQYQDTNNDYLLEQGEASDWADEMPRHGSVLYTNALWYWFVSLYAQIENSDDLIQLKKRIHEGFNTLFWVHKGRSDRTNYIPDNEYTRNNRYAHGLIEITNSKAVFLPYYLGYVTHKSFEMRCDVFGNLLACLVGLANPARAELITDFILRAGVNKPYPIKVLYPPIYPGEMDFKEFMTKGRQNYPWQYHNGGIWPFVGGFWIMWLAKQKPELAKEELVKLAEANSLYDFEFNEYLHGQHGTPMGIPHQSWNMAMYIAAFHAIESQNTVSSLFV